MNNPFIELCALNAYITFFEKRFIEALDARDDMEVLTLEEDDDKDEA